MQRPNSQAAREDQLDTYDNFILNQRKADKKWPRLYRAHNLVKCCSASKPGNVAS